MMRHFALKPILLLLVVIMSVTITAQEKNEDNESLSKVIEQYVNEVAKVKELESKLAQSDKRVKELEDLLKRDTIRLHKEINNLQKELQKEAKSKDRVAVEFLKQQIGNLQDDTTKLVSDIRKLTSQLTKCQDDVTISQQELTDLMPFRELQLKNTLNKLSDWTTLPFSQLNEEQIRQTLQECIKYGSNDKELTKAKDTLQVMLIDLELYRNGFSQLDKVYDEHEIAAVRKQLKPLLQKNNATSRQDELETLDELLRDYDGYVLIFQELIEIINTGVKPERENKNDNGVILMLENLLKESELQTNSEEIQKIPHLKKLFDEYMRDLSEDPLNHSPVESTIQNMIK